jgi:hypothetical protein
MQDLQTDKRALEDTLVLLIFSVVAAFMISILGICLSAHATPPKFQFGKASIAASDTAISFGGTFKNYEIHTSVGASDTYIDWNNGTATNADWLLPGGAGVSVSDGPAITGVHWFGGGSTGTIHWRAW